ncbi:MAG: YqgE/AlgH family protein [Cycloclasticus sp.]|nr:YqgE/AlgH family protein [Cycloclasticus sp.]
MAKPAIEKNAHCFQSTWTDSAAILLSLIFLFSCLPLSAEQTLPENQGRFLVATEQLDHTSFQQAVILITHLSERGATGLTINRPTNIPLTNIFPQTQHLKLNDESLYLGGPVSTNAIFVILRTTQPRKNMHRIAENIYFSTAKSAFSTPFSGDSRVYAGYAGWSPGQLQMEIDRGDWTLIHAEANIIFEKNPQALWQRLSKRWSGLWL